MKAEGLPAEACEGGMKDEPTGGAGSPVWAHAQGLWTLKQIKPAVKRALGAEAD